MDLICDSWMLCSECVANKSMDECVFTRVPPGACHLQGSDGPIIQCYFDAFGVCKNKRLQLQSLVPPYAVRSRQAQHHSFSSVQEAAGSPAVEEHFRGNRGRVMLSYKSFGCGSWHQNTDKAMWWTGRAPGFDPSPFQGRKRNAPDQVEQINFLSLQLSAIVVCTALFVFEHES